MSTGQPTTEKNLYQKIHDEFEYQIRTALARGKGAQKFHDGKLDDTATVEAIDLATKSILEAVHSRQQSSSCQHAA